MQQRRPIAPSRRLCALLASALLQLASPRVFAHSAEPPPTEASTPPVEHALEHPIEPVERPVELVEISPPPTDDHVLEQHRPPREEAHMHPMPVPTRGARRRDKGLRNDRGMLAAGVIFTAICGAGAGLALTAIILDRDRLYGQNSRDTVAAFTGLLGCGAGALALAITGAQRLKKRRAR